jgi:hypothetical protein
MKAKPNRATPHRDAVQGRGKEENEIEDGELTINGQSAPLISPAVSHLRITIERGHLPDADGYCWNTAGAMTIFISIQIQDTNRVFGRTSPRDEGR